MPVKVHKNNNANSEASLQKSRCRGTYFAEFPFCSTLAIHAA